MDSSAWLPVVQGLGMFAVGSGVLGYLARSITKHWLDKDVARFAARLERENAEATERLRATLMREHAAEVEALKADLRVAAHEREVRISRLAEKRAEVIEETYRRLARVHQAFLALMSPVRFAGQPTGKDLIEPAMNAANTFNEYADENQIYFHDELSERIKAVMKELRSIWFDFVSGGSDWVSAMGPGDNEKWKRQEQAWSRLKDRIPELRRDLEAEFRILLGVKGASAIREESEDT